MSAPDNFDLVSPAPYAIYLPAVNSSYPKIIDSEVDLNRSLPNGFSLDDLAFWSGSSQHWNHKFLLHSIGGYSVGSDQHGPLFRRAPGDFLMVGDCGGFQIGKGTLKGLKDLKAGMSEQDAVAAWGRNYDAKMWIINWLEQYCDYAMTIDMPLWAMTEHGKESPFHRCSEQRLLSMTVANLKLIDSERQGRTKWLNVIQGTNPQNTMNWWNAVKWFRGGGWSLAGAAGWSGGIHNLLHIVLTMRDEGAFEAGMDWLHVLGVSQPMWDIFLTAIQRQLRLINPMIQVSCDSATPFEAGGARDQYALPPRLGPKVADWGVGFQTLTAIRSYADRNASVPTPLDSPIGKILTMKDLVVDGSPMSGRRIDNLTNAFLMNHNAWVYLDAGRRANDAAFNQTGNSIPQTFEAVLDIIDAAFNAANWQSLLATAKEFLDTVAATRYK